MLRFWHRVDDPWSHLLLQVLPRLLATYDLGLECVTLPCPLLDSAPRPDLLARHALRDALNLREHLEIGFDSDGAVPDAALAALASQRLLAVADAAEYLKLATSLGNALWSPYSRICVPGWAGGGCGWGVGGGCWRCLNYTTEAAP